MARALPVDELVDERYEIRAALEQAAPFAAYRAFDREVEVEVALWHMRDELFPDSGRRKAFIGAVVAARSLRHANLRRMFDAGDAGGVLYATCQLETDDGMLPRPGGGEVLDDESLLHYATSLVDALEAAHQAGYVHGHLVPNDIVHVAGLIKVGGVGLYGDVDVAASRSVWMADERFIAPEVLSGQRATPSSDVFSLAAMLAELACGASDDDVSATVGRVAAERPALAEVLRLCLSIAPDRRPTSVTDVLDQVAMALGYEPTTAQAPTAAGDDDDEVDTGLQRPITDPPLQVGTADELPTRQLRALGKGRDWADEEELATMVEPPWMGSAGEPPPAVPGAALPGLPGPMPAQAEPLRPANVRMVSRKPKSEPGRPKPTRVPAIERPELKPVVRPISEARRSNTPVPMGNYAPPRAPGTRAPASSRRSLMFALAAGGVALIALIVVLVVWLVRGGGSGQAAVADAGAVVDTPTPVVTTSRDAGAARPCRANMVLVEVDIDDAPHRYCIDRYEAPGEEGRMPSSGLSFTQAEATCRSRDMRLCTPDEWEAACRGERGASWPYGSAYRRGVCNVKESREIAAAGTFPGCKSAAGVFDMSGNVAEWVQGKVVRGGSAADESDGRCSRVVRRAGRSAAAFSDVGYRCCASPRGG